MDRACVGARRPDPNDSSLTEYLMKEDDLRRLQVTIAFLSDQITEHMPDLRVRAPESLQVARSLLMKARLFGRRKQGGECMSTVHECERLLESLIGPKLSASRKHLAGSEARSGNARRQPARDRLSITRLDAWARRD